MRGAVPSGAARDSSAPRRAGLVAVGLGIAVLALKGYAAWRTDSLALLADAAESLVNVVAAIIATAALGASARPAEGHPGFGHGKMEYLSAAIEGALVVLAAFVVAFEAIARYGRTPHLPALGVGLAVSIGATGATALLSRFLERQGRRHRAPALLVEAVHVRADVVISLAVYGGFAIAWATEWWPLDALLALGVTVHILISGLRAVKHSVSGLLDEALPHEETAAIEARLRDEGPPMIGFHDLRARRTGSEILIDFHLVVSRYALLFEAHEICERLRADLGLLLPGAQVTIHVEPEAEPARPLSPRMTL